MDGRGEAMRRSHPEPSTGTERIIQENAAWVALEQGTKKKGGRGGRDKGDKGGPVGARKTHKIKKHRH